MNLRILSALSRVTVSVSSYKTMSAKWPKQVTILYFMMNHRTGHLLDRTR